MIGYLQGNNRIILVLLANNYFIEENKITEKIPSMFVFNNPGLLNIASLVIP